MGISKLHLSFNMTDVHFPNRWQCRSYFSLSCLPLFSLFSFSAFTLFRVLQIKILQITSILKHFNLEFQPDNHTYLEKLSPFVNCFNDHLYDVDTQLYRVLPYPLIQLLVFFGRFYAVCCIFYFICVL